MKTIMIKTTSSGEDYYKNIFNAICDKDGFMTKTDILDILVESDISNDDPHITKLISKLDKLSDIDKIDFDTFQEITFETIGLIEKAVNKGFIIPNYKDFKKNRSHI